jgi:hypothetical protein
MKEFLEALATFLGVSLTALFAIGGVAVFMLLVVNAPTSR